VARTTIEGSILQGESIEIFRAAVKSPATRDHYERHLISFLKMISLTHDNFIDLAKKILLLLKERYYL
jgi:hypothetical protein